jgi:hypothetical protein
MRHIASHMKTNHTGEDTHKILFHFLFSIAYHLHSIYIAQGPFFAYSIFFSFHTQTMFMYNEAKQNTKMFFSSLHIYFFRLLKYRFIFSSIFASLLRNSFRKNFVGLNLNAISDFGAEKVKILKYKVFQTHLCKKIAKKMLFWYFLSINQFYS